MKTLNLKEMREAAGISQTTLAEMIGETTQGAVSQWEQGLSYPKTTKLPLLASVLKVTERDIINAISDMRNTERQAGA